MSASWFRQHPTLSSEKAGWDKLQLVQHRAPPDCIPKHLAAFHTICINTGGPVTLERKIDGRSQTLDALPKGEFGIYPSNLWHEFQWHQQAEFIQLSIRPEWLKLAWFELGFGQSVVLEPRLDLGHDELICQMAIALKTALAIDGTTSKLYADSMANALAAHLLLYYSTERPVVTEHVPVIAEPIKGLSKHQLKAVIDYIHDYLNHDLSLAELAQVAQFSPHHFARLFKQSMGIPPHQYHLQCRIEKAKQLLTERQLSLMDIADAVGFSSQGHLNYHFRRRVGMTPMDFIRKT